MLRRARYMRRLLWTAAALGSLLAVFAPCASATTVTFQNATATYSQDGYPIFNAIDGTINGSGWALSPGGLGTSQSAAFETSADVGPSGMQTTLVFTLPQLYGNKHLIGRFRFSVTTAARSQFADGLASGGNVGSSAIWTVLGAPVTTGPAGLVFTVEADQSVFVSGTVPNTGTYTVTYSTSVTGITGVRLEVMADSRLPSNGPGLQPTNGNIVLSELQLDATSVTAVPEPATALLALLGFAGLVRARRRTSAGR